MILLNKKQTIKSRINELTEMIMLLIDFLPFCTIENQVIINSEILRVRSLVKEYEKYNFVQRNGIIKIQIITLN